MTRTPTMRGGVLVLIILIMISLSVFSVLAWVSADSDLKMAEKNAAWIKQYYELDMNGVNALADARRAFAQAGLLEALEPLGWEIADGSASLDLSIGEGGRAQRLYIEVLPEGERLRIAQWLQRQDPLPDDSYDDNIIIFE